MFRRRASCLPVLLLVAAVADVVHAQPFAWSAPKAIGTSSLYFMSYNGVSVAASDQPLAQSVAVWTEPSTMTIRYAVKRNGAWSGAKTLYRANANASETLTDPQVVIDAAGTATVVWGSTRLGPVTYCFIGPRVYRCPQYISYAKSATLVPGATAWTKAINLSPKGWFVNDVQAGVDATGNLVASWTYEESAAGPWQLQSAVRAAGGAWMPAASMHSAPAIGVPSLAVGAHGDAMIGWVETAGTPAASRLYELSYSPATGTWDAVPTLVALQPAPVSSLRAAFAGRQAALAWTDAGAAVWARRIDGLWGPRDVLTGGPASSPQIGGDSTGAFVATWLHQGAAPDGGNLIVVRTVAGDGTVSEAAWPAGTDTAPSVAVSPDGSAAFVAWPDATDHNIYAVESTAPGTWSAPSIVSSGAAQNTAVWGMGVAAGAGPRGRATLVWLSAAGTNYQISLLAATH